MTEYFLTTVFEEVAHAVQGGNLSQVEHCYIYANQGAPNCTALYRLIKRKPFSRKCYHLFTASIEELKAALSQGYTLEGVAGFAPATRLPGSVPLYSLRRGYGYLYTVSEEEVESAIKEGWSPTGVLCYVYPWKTSPTVPLYRLCIGKDCVSAPKQPASADVKNKIRQYTKLQVGCGYDKKVGYLNIDIDPACSPDILLVHHDMSIFPADHFDEILAKDVIEHIPRQFIMGALLDWAALLKNNGVLSVETSSILGVAENMSRSPSFYNEFNWASCLFGNQLHEGDFHHYGFTEKTLTVFLTAVGLKPSEIHISAGWLLETKATKNDDWTRFLEIQGDNFLIEACRHYLRRDIQDHELAYFRAKDRRVALKEIISSSEHLYKLAQSLGV